MASEKQSNPQLTPEDVAARLRQRLNDKLARDNAGTERNHIQLEPRVKSALRNWAKQVNTTMVQVLRELLMLCEPLLLPVMPQAPYIPESSLLGDQQALRTQNATSEDAAIASVLDQEIRRILCPIGHRRTRHHRKPKRQIVPVELALATMGFVRHAAYRYGTSENCFLEALVTFVLDPTSMALEQT